MDPLERGGGSAWTALGASESAYLLPDSPIHCCVPQLEGPPSVFWQSLEGSES